MAWLAVATGGAVGSLFRYLVMSRVGHYLGTSFPYGTMVVNIIGSLIMGLVIGYFAKLTDVSQEVRLFFIVGVLGGFTTFSTFSLDAISLIERGEWLAMFGYVMMSVFFAIGGLAVGMLIMRGLS